MWSLTSRPPLRTALAGLLVAALAAALILVEPSLLQTAREKSIDIVSRLRALEIDDTVVVVDIDAESAKALGDWPWPRVQLAKLVGAIAAGGPAAIALDLVLSGNCDTIDPGNPALAKSLATAPATIGFVMTDQGTGPAAPSPVALRRPVEIPGLWRSNGAELPCPGFSETSAGIAGVSLAGDSSALVRAVPAVVAVGQELYPGLAPDAVRLARGAGIMTITGTGDPILSIAGLQAHVESHGQLRLHGSNPALWPGRTISAVSALSSDSARFSQKIVFIGTSIPQLGALRPTAASPLTPSTQIHADIASELLAGRVPWRPVVAPISEIVALLAGALVVVFGSLRLKPVATAIVTVAVACTLMVAAVLAYHFAGLVLDPLFPAVGILGSGLACGISQYSAARAAESAIRRSFEQRLPPSVVARLTKAGAGLKLESEERIVTALFTDIEGFTAMTSAAGPHELVRLLDPYFEGVTRIVTDSGGMVDKMIGDAVLALFNVTSKQPDHPARALACAEAILAFSESYRNSPDARRHGFGRTRIGLETGPAIVGDVGGSGKIDYSAYGVAVNTAARLQQANKATGTSILVGPGLKSSNPQGWTLESRGIHDMRGLGPTEVFTPIRQRKG
jgi:adenylate cyclase